MCAACQLLRLVGTSGSAQDEMEGVFGVNGQTANLGTASLERAGYGAGLGVVTVEGERFQGCGGQVYRVPFENKGCLGCIAQTEDRRRRGLDAVGVEDALLERLKGVDVGCLRGVVARNIDVDNAA